MFATFFRNFELRFALYLILGVASSLLSVAGGVVALVDKATGLALLDAGIYALLVLLAASVVDTARLKWKELRR